jgi:replicative DNA helicase
MSNPTTVAQLGRGEMQTALTTLAELHQAEPTASPSSTRATGFTLLDDVLGGGVRPGELLLVGGKPAVGKTIACLQWARTMARRGVVAVYLCYEHDPATLLARLLSCELGELAVDSWRSVDFRLEELEARLRDVAAGTLTLREALESDPLLAEAEQRLAVYADRLVLFQGSGTRTDTRAIRGAVHRFEGEPITLFVDYVQKVPVIPAVNSEEERVGCVIESLKELALDLDVPVVAVAAAGQEGLMARRLHLHHFRGSTALAYEADSIVVLNDKLPVVSRAHLAYSPNLDNFRRQVVFSVEKNRSGVAGIDLEFTKDFAHYRFEPHGSWVTERLWSEGSVET